MLYVELPYGITEGERASLPDTYGIPYFSRNSYIAIPDTYIESNKAVDDSFLLKHMPEHILKYPKNVPLFRSVSYFTDKDDLQSIEVLAKDGNPLYYAGCDTLYFDIDNESTLEAQFQCRKLINYLKTIGIHHYNIYYSGSKGFHIAIPLKDVYGEHTLLHVDQIKLLVDTYISKLSGVTLDKSIYNVRSIIRVANTINLKTRLFKIQLTEAELFGDLGDIEILAINPRTDPALDVVSTTPSDYSFLKNLIALSGDLVAHNLTTRRDFIDVVDGNIDPITFVEEFIDQGQLKPGTRHNVSLVLATYFRARGFTQSEAEAKLIDFMTRAKGSNTSVAQRIRESRNDVKTCYNKVIRFSKYKALEVLE